MESEQVREAAAGQAVQGVMAGAARSVTAETHHRVTNHLSTIVSLIRITASSVAREKEVMTSDEVRGLLEDVSARIEAVAVLHRLLQDVPGSSPLSLADYLRRICAALTSSLASPGRVTITEKLAHDCLVSPDRLMPFGLIVSELVTNAIKYAHPAGAPGHIVVGCRKRSGGELLVEVQDDGVGLPEGLDPETGGGLGFRLVRGLSKQLGGKVAFEASDLGLRVRVSVPDPRKAKCIVTR